MSLVNFNGDFPGGPAEKNLPSKAGDVGWIPGQGTGMAGNGTTNAMCYN